MKDWTIQDVSLHTQYGNVYRKPQLVHIHPPSNTFAAYEREDGRWRCNMCGAEAPEEMEFVAELAGCHGRYHRFPSPPRVQEGY